MELRGAPCRSQRNHLGWRESRASQKVSRGEKAGKWCGSTRAMMVAPMLVDICGLLRSIILLLDMVGCSMHGIVFMGFRRSRMNTGQENRHSRSEEHTSELQSLMRISYAVFCLKKKRDKIEQSTRT